VSAEPTRAEALHEAIEARLRLADQRYTAGRRLLVDLLVRSDHPVSIGDIGAALPTLPRSTAYRNLVDLQAAGVVRRVAAGDEFIRFELAEELTGHHHHLLCLHCGRVLDVDSDVGFESTIAEMAQTLASRHRFVTRDHRLDILGLCAACASSAE
jgi:Fur family transcriptional regulator, ferric uptake regulator